MKKNALYGLLPHEIADFLNEKPFRGTQIFKWLYSGISSFEEMTNLSKDLRTNLSENSTLFSSSVTQKLCDDDGTIKLQITLSDGNAVECVLLTDLENRLTACVSCQVGCAMNCAFCKTGTLTFKRNLTAAEIVEQFLFLEQLGKKIDSIVFMGMGEPLLNRENIRKSIEILSNVDGRNFSKRRITLSTCGIIEGIYDFANNGPPVRLAVSLTCADEKIRENLMPVTKTNPLKELKQAIAFYTEKTNSRCTLEIPLIDGINTSNLCIEKLIDFCSGLNVHINLIPWNKTENMPFKTPSGSLIGHIKNTLIKAHLPVTQRTKRGKQIGGACGQLGKIVTENTDL